MKLPAFVRGTPQVALQEFITNLKSIRLIAMALLSALIVVGGAFGFSALSFSGSGPSLPQIALWGHPAYASNGTHVAVVWVADPYGEPHPGGSVEFRDANDTSIGAATSDPNGFARLTVGNRDIVSASVRIGTFETSTSVTFSPLAVNFTVYSLVGDFARHGRIDGLALSVLNLTGAPATADVAVNGTSVGTTNRYGYLQIQLPFGRSVVNVTVAGETESMPVFAEDFGGGLPFASGPDFVLAIIVSLSFVVVSIFAIVISFDAISKERVQGTMDLLLSRPASRTGVLIGKLLGAFFAVALPVTVVNLAGIGAIAAASGKGPTGAFAAAFVGGSLLLIVLYILVQFIWSTLAKTSGTAVLFGVLVWLLFNILYPIVTAVIANLAFSNDPAGYFRFNQAAALGNPTSISANLVFLSAPPNLGGFAGSALDPVLLGAAAIVWFAALFFLALWTFNQRGVE